jgi:hypothetical protein
VASSANAQTTREAASEIVSVALFRKAHEAVLVITRRWVDEQLGRLRSHPETCRCNEPCGLSHLVTANKVHWTAVTWQRSIRARALLARR